MKTDLFQQIKETSSLLPTLTTEVKNNALNQIIIALNHNKELIFNANATDLKIAQDNHIPAPTIARLKFDQKKLDEVTKGLNDLILLDDPIGKELMITELDDGLLLKKIAYPIGVIGVIFESRPDALVQISTLCLKSSNAVLLKGGSEAFHTNAILFEIIYQASITAGIPEHWAGLLTTRQDVAAMLKLDQYIDLIIPRGSNEFVKYIMENSLIPVLGHADGICHLYIDSECDLSMAIQLTIDSKTQYVSVCNALETLLVHTHIAKDVLPGLYAALLEKQVKVLGCPKTQQIIPVEMATDMDWRTEYLDYVLSIKIVDSLEEGIHHINTYGSGHTDSIVTSLPENAEIFMNRVDSGNVFYNCSTRFSDGLRYGFGAEVGVSTNKIHARGPVGLDGLTIYKYKLYGHGQIVSDYSLGIKKFKHKKIK